MQYILNQYMTARQLKDLLNNVDVAYSYILPEYLQIIFKSKNTDSGPRTVFGT